ncbi:MAG: serine acetyltransferase [Clostridia bacterium]|nr:serine acetyltransferase [Clostridia bacterium]
MTDTPRTIDANIARLTDALLADYSLGRHIDRIEPFSQPDRDVIIAILTKLKRLLFPGYFRDPCYRVYSMRHSLCALMEDVAYHLGQQIAIALREGETVDADRAQALDAQAQELTIRFLDRLPQVRALLETDLQAAFDGDPAAQSMDEIIIAYPGLQAIMVNRIAHELFLLKVPLIPRIMTEYAHSRTGIDIHPGATIGRYFFIDHGTGIVVGETTVIGDYVKIYQGVTLGALSTRGGQSLRGRRRHPTIEDRVTIYSGASVLGGDTIIGHDAVIGGNAFITSSIAPGTRVSVRSQELELKPGKVNW